MALKAIDRSNLPVRSAGQSSIPQEDQAILLSLLQGGESVTNGETYDNAKVAAKRAGPFRRFVKRMVKNGTLLGTPRFVTFPAKGGKGTQWAIYLQAPAAAAE